MVLVSEHQWMVAMEEQAIPCAIAGSIVALSNDGPFFGESIPTKTQWVFAHIHLVKILDYKPHTHKPGNDFNVFCLLVKSPSG